MQDALQKYYKALDVGIDATGEPTLRTIFEGTDHSHMPNNPMPMWESLITRPILRAMQGNILYYNNAIPFL